MRGPETLAATALAALLFSLANGAQTIHIQRGPQHQCVYFASPDSSKVSIDLTGYGPLNGAGTIQDCGAIKSARKADPTTAGGDDEFRLGHCVSIWEEETGVNGTVQRPLLQGCWYGKSIPACESSNCTTSHLFNQLQFNNSYFCCCDGHMCNQRFAFVPDPVITAQGPQSTEAPLGASLGWSSLIYWLGFATLALVFLAFLWRRRPSILACSGTPDPEKTPPDLLDHARLLDIALDSEADHPANDPTFDISSITLLRPIGQGRYGSVFLGQMKDGSEVAVKVYQPKSREFFLNELQVYQLPHMRHAHVLHFLGWGELEKRRSEGTVQALGPSLGGQVSGNSENAEGLGTLGVDDAPSLIRESWLITAFHPRGNLQEFLKQETLSWESFCRMGLSLTDGLAYLHSQVTEGGASKPSIAHRDLSSRNVLVGADGSLILCDLGFAHPLSAQFLEDAAQDGHGVALNEVGTVRYMCPEILEGAVNLLDPVAALKAIDVYAMGFVLWELLYRTHDIWALSPGGKTPEYRAPLSEEVDTAGLTLETMQVWVCRRKVRPTLPPPLRKVQHQVIRSLRELVEDSWDSDAEARPSAICAHYRIRDLANVKFDSVRRAGLNGVSGEESGSESVEEEGKRPPSPGALQPYQGLNPCQERNLYHLSEGEKESSTSISLREASYAQFGPKPDPCSPLTLRHIFAVSESEKKSNAEQEARNAAAAAQPHTDLLLALLRAEVASLPALPSPPSPAPPSRPPLHQSASTKSIQLSHANRLFEDREPPLGRLESPASNHSSPDLEDPGSSSDSSNLSNLCLTLSTSSDALHSPRKEHRPPSPLTQPALA